ncbi:hypothetical protein HK405_011583, partial [Cladochytrium tenue]
DSGTKLATESPTASAARQAVSSALQVLFGNEEAVLALLDEVPGATDYESSSLAASASAAWTTQVVRLVRIAETLADGRSGVGDDAKRLLAAAVVTLKDMLVIASYVEGDEKFDTAGEIIRTTLAQLTPKGDDDGNLTAQKTCVQCGKDFKESENTEGACAYHPVAALEGSGWTYKVRCCGRDVGSSYTPFPQDGCKRARHSSEHHQKFMYPNRLGHINSRIKNIEEWVKVFQRDPDSGSPVFSVSCRFGYVPGTDRVVFSASQAGKSVLLVELDAAVELARAASTTRLPNLSPVAVVDEWISLLSQERRAAGRGGGSGGDDRQWWMRASWIIESAKITGIRMEAKTPTMDKANVTDLFFDASALKPGLTKVYYDDAAATDDLIPPRAYPSPSPSRTSSGPKIPEELFINATYPLPEFAQTGSSRVRIKAKSPVKANPNGSPPSFDDFQFDVMLVGARSVGGVASDTAGAGQQSPEAQMMVLTMLKEGKITATEAERLLLALRPAVSAGVATPAAADGGEMRLVDLAGEFSLDDGVTWEPALGALVGEAGGSGGGFGPLGVLALRVGDAIKMRLQIKVPCEGKPYGWHNGRSFLSRLSTTPLLLRATFEDLDGESAVVTVAHRNGPFSGLAQRNAATDWLFVATDDLAEFTRNYAK